MPDDPNAALIERMLDTYEDAPLDMSDEEAMSRVLAVVREHEGQALAEAQKRIAEMEAEVSDLKVSVCAFGAPAMVRYAEGLGLPYGHLHPRHYDILKRAGARMNSFTRAELAKEMEKPDA